MLIVIWCLLVARESTHLEVALVGVLLAIFVGEKRALLLKCTLSSASKPLPELCGEASKANFSHSQLLAMIYHIWLHISQSVLTHIWPGFDCAFKDDLFWLGISSWPERFPGKWPCKTGISDYRPLAIVSQCR